MSWEIALPVALIVAWVIVNRWVLPKMGIRT